MKRIIFIVAIALVGCGKKDDKPPPPPPPTGSAGSATAMTGSGSAAAGSGSATMPAGAGSAVDVPTEDDFEDQSKTTITDKNVEAKTKALEDDLGKQ